MKRAVLTLLIASAALWAASCTTNTAPEEARHAILPLAEGNIWTGTATDRDADGRVLRTRVDTMYVAADRIHGSDRLLLGDLYDGLRNLAGGLHAWTGENAAGAWLLLPYPGKFGDRIERAVGDAGGETLRVVVDASDVNVTVPAGTFVCYHYRLTIPGRAYVVDAYLAPDVGFVKVVYSDSTGDDVELGSSTWELTSYRVL